MVTKSYIPRKLNHIGTIVFAGVGNGIGVKIVSQNVEAKSYERIQTGIESYLDEIVETAKTLPQKAFGEENYSSNQTASVTNEGTLDRVTNLVETVNPSIVNSAVEKQGDTYLINSEVLTYAAIGTLAGIGIYEVTKKVIKSMVK